MVLVGGAVKATVGGVESTKKVRVAVAPTLPATSVGVTVRVKAPSPHAVAAAPVAAGPLVTFQLAASWPKPKEVPPVVANVSVQLASGSLTQPTPGRQHWSVALPVARRVSLPLRDATPPRLSVAAPLMPGVAAG